MGNTYESSPFYRLFNVILFLFYAFVILITAGAGYLAYTSRTVTNATVQCKDGTSWDAFKPKNIYNDSDALCGLCTKRDKAGTYNYCTYQDYDYSSYDITNKQYAWSWWVIFAPLIVFTVGFGIVDFLRLIVVYILSGQLALEKSLLLRLLVAMLSSDNKNKEVM